MNLHNASITISAAQPSQYPYGVLPEIALAGRSNVGKSSFINKLLGRKNLARTSSSPGKTATLNFYNIDDTFYFVDLPGYGYAKVSHETREKWADMINMYLERRENLTATFLLVDARHTPTQNDLQMFNWIRHRHGSAVVIATKCDKIAKTKLNGNIDEIFKFLKIGHKDLLIPFSAETGLGYDEAWQAITSLLPKS
jgi:GTP-binding protein